MKVKNTFLLEIPKIIFIIVLFLGINFKSNAFELSPVVVTLEPQGIKAEQVYLLTNSLNSPAAIEFSITTREQRRDGTEIRKPAADLFNLYPSQVVIPAGGTQKVRLKWLGKKTVTEELPYRFIAKQLPVKLSADKGISLNVVMAMESIVYINPPQLEILPPYNSTKPSLRPLEQLKITSIKTKVGLEEKQLMLTVTNHAKKHIHLHNTQIQLTTNGQNIVLKNEQLGDMQQHNILNNTVRDFVIPFPKQFNEQQNWVASIQEIPLLKTE